MTKNNSQSWFEVDKDGLAKLLKRKGGRGFLLYELLQNAFDENTKRVIVTFTAIATNTVQIVVLDDNPDGFHNLSHAFTLFAESVKKSDPQKRGRFNLGEKLVIACCKRAKIFTTKGTITFEKNGKRSYSKRCREWGSEITLEVKMTAIEYKEILDNFRLVVPKEITLTLNRREIKHRMAIAAANNYLPTIIAKEDGVLVSSMKKTDVFIYDPIDSQAYIYEMGIPICPIDDKFDVDVQQKVPMSLERCTVTPAYLKRLRTIVLNATHDLLAEEDATETWVQEASDSKDCSDDAIKSVVDLKYGKDKVVFDASDPEANKLAVVKGFTVVHGGSMSKGQWANTRRAKAILPAGQVTPSPKPFMDGGIPLTFIFGYDWNEGEKLIANLARMLSRELLSKGIKVQITNTPDWNFVATYGKDTGLILNRAKLFSMMVGTSKDGKRYLLPAILEDAIQLLIHELAHDMVSDHLSEAYYKECCRLGAAIAMLALDRPEVFDV